MNALFIFALSGFVAKMFGFIKFAQPDGSQRQPGQALYAPLAALPIGAGQYLAAVCAAVQCLSCSLSPGSCGARTGSSKSEEDRMQLQADRNDARWRSRAVGRRRWPAAPVLGLYRRPRAATPVAARPGASPVTAGTAAAAGAPREFRAAWVATVANIDWPSKPDLNGRAAAGRSHRHPRPRQGAEPERHRAAGAPGGRRHLPVGDRAVVGIPHRRAGQAPQPVRPAGILGRAGARARPELHAWFNPYRARQQRRQVAGRRQPHLAAPTRPSSRPTASTCGWTRASDAAAKQTLDVVLDVVRRYDVDGVHIDDYFYPYPIEADRRRRAKARPWTAAAARAEAGFPGRAVVAALPGRRRQARPRRLAPRKTSTR